MKCRNATPYNVLCMQCDIKSIIKCSIKFDFDKPKKFIRVKRDDMIKTVWNECPTCGNSIGYSPKNKNFRCTKCKQLIDWNV